MVQSLSFGELLKRYRVIAQLTQEELAAHAGLSPAAISTLERGARRAPRKETTALLAEALHLSPQEKSLFLRVAVRKSGSATPHALHDFKRSRESSSPFVGRSRELALIDRFLAGVGPPLLLVAGEPGIGKSRLLREAEQCADPFGWILLEDGCSRRSGQEPYAPVLGALATYIRRRPPALLHVELQGCSWLVRLLPELAETTLVPVPQWTLPPEQERRLMFAAVGRFLSNAGGPAGALLVLDDLQWAGPDALDLLDTLVRTASETRVRVLGAYRNTEMRLRSALSILQSDLAREGLATRIELGPLSPPEGRAMLANLLEGQEQVNHTEEELILQRTGGVPFFLVSCARSLQAGVSGVSGEADMPWDVRENIRQRVAALPQTAQELLSVAAVVGRELRDPLLGAIVVWPEAKLLAALETLCSARLLAEDGENYRFAHDLIREVVDADLSSARRRTLHKRVAEAYECQSTEPPMEVLAHHYERGGAREKAAEYLQRAGNMAAAVFAYAEAESYYRAAIKLAGRLGDHTREAIVCERLGDILALLAHRDQAQPAYEQALAAYQALGDIEGVRRTTARLMVVRRYLGVPPAESLERLQRVFAHLDHIDEIEASPALAELYNVRGMLRSDRRLDVEAVADHRRAAEIAETIGARRLQAQARFWQGRALRRARRIEETASIWEESIPLFEAADDLPGLCWLLNNTAEFYIEQGNFARARLVIERATALAEQLQSSWHVAMVLGTASQLAFYCGEWPRAYAGFERAASLARELGEAEVRTTASCKQGLLLFVSGAVEAGVELLETATAHNPYSQGDVPLVLNSEARRALAERDLLEGRLSDARERFANMPTDDGAYVSNIMVTGMPWLAWADLGFGHGNRAIVELDQHIASLTVQGYSLEVVDALRVKAHLALLQGRWAEALSALEDTLAQCRAMPYPYAEAKAHYVFGRLHIMRGEPDQARERHETALNILRRLGERLYAEHVERALADLR
jgi:tetratricopeptide (TPR) repeat protein/transcriptional regulator with XRE-family HTH domain